LSEKSYKPLAKFRHFCARAYIVNSHTYVKHMHDLCTRAPRARARAHTHTRTRGGVKR
jgi:hypothetical protein